MHAALAREITPESVLAALARRIGPANGATVRELASEILGTPSDAHDERLLRQVVMKLRCDGYAICATPSEGYHYGGSAADLERTCLQLAKRGVSAFKQAYAMRRVAMPDFYGQLGLPQPANEEGTNDDA